MAKDLLEDVGLALQVELGQARLQGGAGQGGQVEGRLLVGLQAGLTGGQSDGTTADKGTTANEYTTGNKDYFPKISDNFFLFFSSSWPHQRCSPKLLYMD